MLEILQLQLGILLILAMVQPTYERRYAGLVFAVIAGLHYLLSYSAEGWGYYFSAATADAVVVMLTIRLKILSPVISTIHTICYVSIVMNFIGWIMWMSHIHHYAYNAAFLLIYGWAIINLSRKERADDGTIALGMGHHHVHSSACTSNHSNTKQAN